jgi:hypothetical protein
MRLNEHAQKNGHPAPTDAEQKGAGKAFVFVCTFASKKATGQAEKKKVDAKSKVQRQRCPSCCRYQWIPSQ